MSQRLEPRRPALSGRRLRAAALVASLAVAGNRLRRERRGRRAERHGRRGRAAVASGGTLTYAVDQDPGALDPHMTVLSVTREMAKFAYDTLVYTDEDGETVPGLAEAWEVEGNALTYTLREGVTCADGSPLTASDGRSERHLRRGPRERLAGPGRVRAGGHRRHG
jgi:ABC-type transport system substrate-binding protein